MRHFIAFISVVFLGLGLYFLKFQNQTVAPVTAQKPLLHVITYSSFAADWGPGPLLKTEFEKTCNCEVKFLEVADSGLLIQRLQMDGAKMGVDLVVGMDQFDLDKAKNKLPWRDVGAMDVKWVPEVQDATSLNTFVPFDWGFVAFNTRKGELSLTPTSLKDLLNPSLKGQIALIDPRTSSPGMQFVFWVIQTMGLSEGESFLKSMVAQAHSFSPGWSVAYGLFQKKQAAMALSYITSPIYHLVEEKNEDYISLEFQEGHPQQIEFMAVPEFCRNCDLAENFMRFMLSEPGQRIIMNKNFMFPVLTGVIAGTPFESLPPYKKVAPFRVPTEEEIKGWNEVWNRSRQQP